MSGDRDSFAAACTTRARAGVEFRRETEKEA